MTFGDPTDFAIEVYHEPSGPQWGGFGRMCLHVQSMVLGDIRENHCSLFHATGRIREVAADVEFLWDESFTGLSDMEIFGLINREIYTDECSENGQRFRACNFLTGTGEVFDDSKTFVIFRRPDRLHILYCLRDDTLGSVSCSVPTFCRVTDSYVSWFDEQVRTTAPPFFPINPLDLSEEVPEGWPPGE